VPPSESATSFRLGDTLHALLVAPPEEPFPNLADALYEQMWRRIVNLEFPPGSRLSDEALAKQLGVSRTPMREALYRLSQVGLVRINARRGFFVPTVSASDVAELYDLRTALETHAAREAAPLISADEIAEHVRHQRVADQRATSLLPAAVEDFMRADLQLHDLLLRRAGNGRILRIAADVLGQLSLATMRTAQMPERRMAAIAEHERILAALAEGDADAAATGVGDHIQAVKARVLDDFYSG
jgi:DNA-binding GntR family transcriptional regulator